jgi:hypothetical protein
MRRVRCPARCQICGTLVPSKVSRHRKRETICKSCQDIRQKAAGEDSAVDELHERRFRLMRDYVVLRRVIAGLVLPGSVHHIAGKRLKGILMSTVIIALLLPAIAGGSLVGRVPHLKSDITNVWPVILFVLTYAVYAWRSTVLAIRSVKEE